MKKQLVKWMLGAMMCTLCTAASAAEPNIDGMVLDAEGQPMGFVNVVLLSLPDSAFIQGATSGADGHFHIAAEAAKGLLRATCVGYETVYINMSDFKGQIQMHDDVKMLGEVTVKGQLPKTKLTGNSMVTLIEGTVLEKSGSAKEMLSKVPGMTKKGDDLEVLGRGTPIYYINGRRMQDGDELKRLRSEEIKEVEVITNPGAQYDATVKSVVRIKTLKPQGSGFGFDVTAEHSQSLQFGFADPGLTTNLRYRYKSFDVFGMVNYWTWDESQVASPWQWSYMDTDGALQCIEQQVSVRSKFHGRGLNYHLGMNWQITENHSVGMRIGRKDNFKYEMNLNQQTLMNQFIVGQTTPLATVTDISRERAETSQPYYWEGNAYYNGKVGKLGIDFNVDFISKKSDEKKIISDLVDDNFSLVHSSAPTVNEMIANKLVLNYPVWKGMLQFGTEMSFVNRESKYQIEGIGLPNTNSKTKEQNIAGFLEYGFQLPKVGVLSAGLRYEHVDFKYDDLYDATGSMKRVTDDIYPTLSWANQFGRWQTSLSYSLKTNRPDFWMLDESIQRINSYSLQQGDPKLKNEKIQSISAMARYKWMTLSLMYSRTDDALTQWSFIYNDEGMILIKNINLDVPLRNLTFYANLNPTWGVFSPNWTVGMQKPNMKLTLADPREPSGKRIVKYVDPIVFVRLNNAVRLKHSWQLEANLAFNSRGSAQNVDLLGETYSLQFALQKCWLKNDALTLRASIDDILQRSDQKLKMDCGYYDLIQHSIGDTHRFSVSLRYAFNATQSKYKGTGAGKAAAERLSQQSK